ncbi:hypothetical protein LOD99_6559 [Oopsacas minuta]|uniref:Uncharacterized protein n=1 Tax=Oopsacas minuta TaxID=111878 RepID=A0AAV7JLJ4_9METZ|nr:hypothetical protein LOD99_6559 [Oopsacas minuta]
MFSDAETQVVDIISRWLYSKSKDDNSTQTANILITSQGCNSTELAEVPCQTDETIVEDKEMAEDSNPSATLEFLLRVEPEITKILKQNLLSHAFDSCSLSWDNITPDKKTGPLFTLKHKPPSDSETDMPVTALTWSATGSVIAAGYGHFNHIDLCWHKSSLLTWNLDRHASKAADPDTSLLVDNCIMSLAFHPERAVILTGGVFNGNIIVWDLGREDEHAVVSTFLLQFGHTDPVNQIQWIKSGNKSRLKQYNILSFGGDGRIIIWEVELVKKSIVPMFQCRLVTSCIPKNIRVKKGRAQDALGISYAGLSHDDSKILIVGTEGGNVFKCSLHGIVLKERTLLDKVIEDSIVNLAFKPIIGPIYSVSCSYFHRNIFLTCGTDAAVSIYSMLDINPIMMIHTNSHHYLFCAEWSPFRPGVFICGSGSGEILIYDICHSRHVPVDTILTNIEKRPVYTVKFNEKRRQLVASGDGTGTVVIWELSSELCNQKQNELKVLERLHANARDVSHIV